MGCLVFMGGFYDAVVCLAGRPSEPAAGRVWIPDPPLLSEGLVLLEKTKKAGSKQQVRQFWLKNGAARRAPRAVARRPAAFIASGPEQYLDGADVLGSPWLSWTFLSMSPCFS